MKKIKLLLTDVDGCLTDGSVYYGPNHEKIKKFNMQDGMALKLLRENNILTGIISADNSEATRYRAEDLKFDFIGVSEEIVKSNKANIQEITLTYKSIYDGKILDKTFKGIESDWINFEWVKIEEIDKYEIHPTQIKDFIKNEKQTNHIIEEIIM